MAGNIIVYNNGVHFIVDVLQYENIYSKASINVIPTNKFVVPIVNSVCKSRINSVFVVNKRNLDIERIGGVRGLTHMLTRSIPDCYEC